MDKKTYTIGILAVVAALLLVANLMPKSEPTAHGAFSIKDRNYQLVTARATKGGELLYVIDNLSGKVAVFVWENNQVRPLLVQSFVGN